MVDTLERRDQLVGAKTGYTEFVQAGGIIEPDRVHALSENLSDRMKRLIMSTMSQIYNRRDAVQLLRSHLYGILKEQSLSDIQKRPIKLEQLKNSGYNLMNYDQELAEDFPPYKNELMHISVDNIQKPHADDNVKANLTMELSFPHKIEISKHMPQEILAHILQNDPTGGNLKNAPWLGKHMEGPPPYDHRTPLLQLALEKIFMDYATGHSHTDIMLSPGASYSFTERHLHRVVNELLQGIVEIELLNNNQLLRYHVLPGQ